MGEAYSLSPATLTFCSMRPSSSGRWAAMNQSPAAGLVRLKVVELCDVTGRVSDRLGLQSVALGNDALVGFITGGAPHRMWLHNYILKKERRFGVKWQCMGERCARVWKFTW